jgi:hypothetical protein
VFEEAVCSSPRRGMMDSVMKRMMGSAAFMKMPMRMMMIKTI